MFSWMSDVFVKPALNRDKMNNHGVVHNNGKFYSCFLSHICFRGSMNCGACSMGNSFQITKFLFDVWKISTFCLVQSGPFVIWVACIGLRERSKWSFSCARAFLEAFWTFSNTWDTQSQRAGHMTFQKKLWHMDIYAKKASIATTVFSFSWSSYLDWFTWTTGPNSLLSTTLMNQLWPTILRKEKLNEREVT